MCLYKSQTHASNYCKFQLSSDIEKNPGPTPMYIDPSKTIMAPCSQANELVFGQNSGQQCVTMSLCSLIYNNKQGINSANDLVSIMNIGASWYLSMFLVIDPCVFIRVRHTYQTIANFNWVQI